MPATMMAAIRPQIPRLRRQAAVHDLGRDRDDAEVKADQQRRRQRVGDAALEDQVDVHQPVADDGPAEGQRQDDQREPREFGQRTGHRPVGEIGNDVEA